LLVSMRLLECDVVVVGAGPAGSMAAKAAAEGGADVLLLEEHPQVGYPIYCAEWLSLNGIRDAGLRPEPPLVSQEITKARVYAPDRNFIDLTSSQWSGYNLNREAFDRAVAENAVESGAELMTSTVATRVLKEEGLRHQENGRPRQVVPRCLHVRPVQAWRPEAGGARDK
jgi:digeranylgeranylglycerophospholipid reductase